MSHGVFFLMMLHCYDLARKGVVQQCYESRRQIVGNAQSQTHIERNDGKFPAKKNFFAVFIYSNYITSSKNEEKSMLWDSLFVMNISAKM